MEPKIYREIYDKCKKECYSKEYTKFANEKCAEQCFRRRGHIKCMKLVGDYSKCPLYLKTIN